MQVRWTDWTGAALYTGIALVIVAGIVALLVWDARRRKSPSVTLDVVAALARVWVAAVLLGVVVMILQWSTTDWTRIEALPVSAAWPVSLPCNEPTAEFRWNTAALECASFSSASGSVVGVDAGLRTLLASGAILSLLVSAVPGLLIAAISQRAISGAPFARNAARWLLVGAAIVLVAGTLGPVLTQVGEALVAQAVLPAPGGDAPVTAESVVGFTTPLWPLGVALGLSALSVIFRQGARLQRDTEGLV